VGYDANYATGYHPDPVNTPLLVIPFGQPGYQSNWQYHNSTVATGAAFADSVNGVTSAYVTDDGTLQLTMNNTLKTQIESSPGYGSHATGDTSSFVPDSLSIASSFVVDAAGNASYSSVMSGAVDNTGAANSNYPYGGLTIVGQPNDINITHAYSVDLLANTAYDDTLGTDLGTHAVVNFSPLASMLNSDSFYNGYNGDTLYVDTTAAKVTVSGGAVTAQWYENASNELMVQWGQNSTTGALASSLTLVVPTALDTGVTDIFGNATVNRGVHQDQVIGITFANGSELLYNTGGSAELNSSASSTASVTNGRGDDQLIAGDYGDRLIGNAGNDLLIGGYGSDAIYGGTGADVLFGEFGNNYLSGGAGADHFVFDSLWTQSQANWFGANGIWTNMSNGNPTGQEWYRSYNAESNGPTYDVISDFKAGTGGDVLTLAGLFHGTYVGGGAASSGAAMLAMLQDTNSGHGIEQVGSDTVIHLNENHAVRLLGVAPTALTAANFDQQFFHARGIDYQDWTY
jgi:Ca2+-binding RTX toxin-like protein